MTKKGIALHYAVIPAETDHANCQMRWDQVIAMHRAQGYKPPPAYNWGVCVHGFRFEGRGWNMQSAAQGTNDANRDYFAI